MNSWIKLGIAIAALLMAFAEGWHEKAIRVEASQEKAAVRGENKAADAQAKIITKTEVVTRIIHDNKSPCTNQPVPSDLLQQLK